MNTTWYKHFILPMAFLLTIAGLAIGNDYYTHGGYPATGSAGSSALMRAELDSITAGFDKLPTFAGNGNRAVIVNGGATALSVTTGTLALAGNFATTGAFNTTIAQSASTTFTLPGVSGTAATLAGSETLTNKTLTAPTLSGVVGGSGYTFGAHTISGTLTPTKACNSGYTRVTPNYCRNTVAGGPASSGALVEGSACTNGSTGDAVPSGSVVDVIFYPTVTSANATGNRSLTFTSYTTAPCTGGTEDKNFTVGIYEQTATAGAQTLLAQPLVISIKFVDTGMYYKVVGVDSSVFFRILGYYD